MGSLAQCERELTIERTRARLAAARRRGVTLGPTFILTPASKAVTHARKLITAGEPVGEVPETLGVSRATLYRILKRAHRNVRFGNGPGRSGQPDDERIGANPRHAGEVDDAFHRKSVLADADFTFSRGWALIAG